MNSEDLPGPGEILDQLAGNVLTRISERSVAGFDIALREMTDFHRLLFDLFAKPDADGQPDSYAQHEAGWSTTHQTWLQSYTPVIERAVDTLGEAPDYFRKVAHLPFRLTRVDGRLPTPMLNAVMALGVRIVLTLETWFTKRAALAGSDRSENNGTRLIGSDRSSYEEAILAFIGAWEAVRFSDGELRANEAAVERWEELRRNTPSALAHLRSTARFYVIAAWNRDDFGVRQYADMLLGWRFRSSRAEASYLFKEPWLLTSDLFDLSWDEAKAALAHRVRAYALEDLTPDAVASQIIANIQTHITVLSAAVVLRWRLRGKAGPFALEAAKRLIDPAPSDESVVSLSRARRLEFGERLRALLAIQLAGPRHTRSGYGGYLDEVVQSLDNISERRVISGRVYSPTTIYDRDELSMPLTLLTIASGRGRAGDQGAKFINEFIDENSEPYNSKLTSEMDDVLSRLQNDIGTISDIDLEVLETISPLPNWGEVIDEASGMVNLTLPKVRALRSSQIASQPIAAERVGILEREISTRLTTGTGHIPLFNNFALRVDEHDWIDIENQVLRGLPKTEFLDPPLDTQSSNFMDVVSRECADLVAEQRMWRDLLSRPIEPVRIRSMPDTLRFWQSASKRCDRIGDDPILVFTYSAYERFAEAFLYGRNRTSDLHIERRPEVDHGYYRQTVNGIDVHQVNIAGSGPEAYLLSGRLLSSVRYRRMANGLPVKATVLPMRTDKAKVAADIQFGIEFDWLQGAIYHYTWS